MRSPQEIADQALVIAHTATDDLLEFAGIAERVDPEAGKRLGIETVEREAQARFHERFPPRLPLEGADDRTPDRCSSLGL
jgi:hypothetical protein